MKKIQYWKYQLVSVKVIGRHYLIFILMPHFHFEIFNMEYTFYSGKVSKDIRLIDDLELKAIRYSIVFNIRPLQTTRI